MWTKRCREDKMYRTQCVLALLALYAGLAHSFTWDVVIGTTTLEFYNKEGTLTCSATTSYKNIFWITYDPFNNRVLFIDDDHKNEVYSFDIATKETQSLVKINKLELRSAVFAYDPATSLLFGMFSDKMYSFLIKSGSNNKIDGNLVIDLQKKEDIVYVAVDSCGGYIYWISPDSHQMERVRFNGTEREVIIPKMRSKMGRACLTIDSQAHKIFWVEYRRAIGDFYVVSADMNGKNKTLLYVEAVTAPDYYFPGGLTVSKDFIYWGVWNKHIFWQLPQNLQSDTDIVESKQITIRNSNIGIYSIAGKYEIEEQTLGIPLCKALKSLLPNNSATNDCDSLNVPSEVNLLCVHGTKVSGESRCECAQGYSGERCDVSVCHNYCLHGDCSASEGQRKCRCNAGYSGERCEVDPCQGYCLNNGACSLNDESYPVCKCSEGYDGERCHHPVFLGKSYEKFECWRTF